MNLWVGFKEVCDVGLGGLELTAHSKHHIKKSLRRNVLIIIDSGY